MTRETTVHDLARRPQLQPDDRVPISPSEYASRTIIWATQDFPVVMTASDHGFFPGDRIFVTGIRGMEVLNDRTFTVGKTTKSTFELADIDGRDFPIYVSGGKAIKGRIEYATLRDLRDYFAGPEENVTPEELKRVQASSLQVVILLDGARRCVSLETLFRAFSEHAAARESG